MANAKRDQNYVPTLIVADQTDGVTPVNVRANPIGHGISLSNGTTGSDLTGDKFPVDGNYVPVACAVSSADGVTPVVLYATPGGGLLVDYT